MAGNRDVVRLGADSVCFTVHFLNEEVELLAVRERDESLESYYMNLIGGEEA